jgi:hypothetical protein
MKGIVRTLVALALSLALVAPAAASTGELKRALDQERYYMGSNNGEPAALQPTRTVTVETNDPGAWKLVAIASGALVLVLGAVELATLARLRGARAV